MKVNNRSKNRNANENRSKGKTDNSGRNKTDVLVEKVYTLAKKSRLLHLSSGEKAKKRREELQCLNPEISIEEIEKEYVIKKIKLLMTIGLVGVFLIICSVISIFSSGILVNGDRIERKTYGKGTLNTTLMAQVVDESIQKESIEVLVRERMYTDEEIQELYEQFVEELEGVLPGENTSLHDVRTDVRLPTFLSEYPFRILWETSDYTLMNPDGTLGERVADESGESVRLTASVTYFDWKRELQRDITVYPSPEANESQWKELLVEQIEKEDLNTATIAEMKLPTMVDGKEIKWKEVQENPTAGLVVLLITVMIVLSIGMDQDVHKKVEERNREMMEDYPEIINKLSLFIGAGMSIRRAWQRIATDYAQKQEKKKRYAYEEMLITCREMESGVAESKSYDNFAKRCQVQSYLKLGTLLSQNLKKGSANLQKVLREEAKSAFEERKSNARRLGEEAGTKLLLPMTFMFGIVMIVVIVPAFLSFSI